jgi:hypothetical protein
MQDLADANFCVFRNQRAAFLCEAAYADQPFRFENLQNATHVPVANFK